MKKKNVYTVVLAGDVNQTLWPLHRKYQSHDLVSVSADQSLLEQALAVTQSYVSFENRLVVLSQEQNDTVPVSIKGLASTFLEQPWWKGTAPAFLQACLTLQESDPEAVVIGIPTDIYLSNPKKCLEFIIHAVDYAAEHSDITLLGIKAAYESTEHSCITYEPSATIPYKISSYSSLEKTTEKFDHYFGPEDQQDTLWDSGIVIVQAAAFVDICKQENALLYETVSAYMTGQGSFEDVPELSLEQAILETTKQAVILPADFSWCSLRSLESFLAVKNHLSGEQNIVTIDSQDNLVEVRDSLVALVGVNNLCVVQSDDVLLVVNRDQLDKVKLVLEMLKQHQSKEYL